MPRAVHMRLGDMCTMAGVLMYPLRRHRCQSCPLRAQWPSRELSHACISTTPNIACAETCALKGRLFLPNETFLCTYHRWLSASEASQIEEKMPGWLEGLGESRGELSKS